jgi:hypothetical protein
MSGADLLLTNLLSPIVLAFLLGTVAGVLRSELELPEPVLKLISIYLLFSIGLTGGRELAHTEGATLGPLIGVTILLTVALPVVTYLVLRRLGRFDAANAAAVAAHYGSVSSVTFFAALAFARSVEAAPAAPMAAVVAIMEWAVIVSLLIARLAMGKRNGGGLRAVVLDTLRGRGILLLSGGMLIGALATEAQWRQIAPFYEGLFRGMLMLFLLEMGMTAARQVREFAKVGVFLTGFAIAAPLCFGMIGLLAGHMIGLDKGSAFVLAAVCASASYIDAPAACRAALPEASPGIYLTASLGITFPFNLLAGLPLYWAAASWLYG